MEASELEDNTVNLLADALGKNYGTISKTIRKESSQEMIRIWEEREKKKRETLKKKMRRCCHLFNHFTWSDKLLMFFGTLFAALSGILLPIRALLFGGMTNLFISQAQYGFIPEEVIFKNVTATPVALIFKNATIGNVFINKDNGSILFEKKYIIEEWFEVDDPLASFRNSSSALPLTKAGFLWILTAYFVMYLLTGTLMIIFSFLQAHLWGLVGERTARDTRKKYFVEVLHRNISWHDVNYSGNLLAKLADDAEKIRDGIGEKCPLIIQDLSAFVAGTVIGLFVNLYLTLAVLCAAPFIIGLNVFNYKFLKSYKAGDRESRASMLGSMTEEVSTNRKAMIAFGTFNYHFKKYVDELEKLDRESTKKKTMLAALVGLAFFIIYLVYALGFTLGAYLIEIGLTNPGNVFTIFFSVIIGAIQLGRSSPSWDSLSEAIDTFSVVINFIEGTTFSDPYARIGRKVSRMAGRVQLKNISFVYPIRPEIRVLDDFNLVVEPGQHIAIVGPRGAGKSAIFNILLRFYNPIAGEVTIDDISVRGYDERWLRRQIGYVPREPVLFDSLSVAENIMCGAEDVTLEAVIEAAKQVNAHDFITNLPKSYDTIVNAFGANLSEGEKQRIAIARALVRSPKILLLDEAMSALDDGSKGIVQDTVETVMRGITTIILERDLSAVKKVDRIYVLQNGKLVEIGTVEELVATESADESVPNEESASEEETAEVEIAATNSADGVSVPSTESASEEIEAERTSESLFVDSQPQTDQRAVDTDNEDSKKSPETKDESPSQQSPNEEMVDDLTNRQIAMKILRLYWPRWTLETIGVISSGLILPLFALCYGTMFQVFTLTGTAFAEFSIFWTCVLVAFSVFCGVSAGIHQATVNRCSRIASATVTGIASVIILLVYGLRMSPWLIIFGLAILSLQEGQKNARARNSAHRDEKMDDMERIMSESVRNIRTVKALGHEQHFINNFSKQLDSFYKKGRERVLKYAFYYGTSSGLVFYMYAFAFFSGGYFLQDGEMDSAEKIYIAFFALSSLCFGMSGSSFLPKEVHSKARHQRRSPSFPIPRYLEADYHPNRGKRPNISGTVELRDVHFSNKSPDGQRNEIVLAGVDLHVNAGKSLALFGESGNGRSTIIALLERFYDPNRGKILIDGFDIRDLNLTHLRSKIGLVTRDPMLFNASVKDNIVYGALSIWREVPFDRVAEAARIANIHGVIMSLPERYNTMIGKQGVQLSEDEKLRIAIARALVRDPKILLVDDITSGLNPEGEEKVKTALDAAKAGRTCIMVSGCLLTVCEADAICMIENGKIVST